jgi:hypothetical protein
LFVTQDRQADNGPTVQVVNPVVVDEHAFGESAFAPTLDFDVNEQPGLLAVVAPDLEQLVSQPSTDAGLADDLLEFLVEALVAAAPVDAGVSFGEAEG